MGRLIRKNNGSKLACVPYAQNTIDHYVSYRQEILDILSSEYGRPAVKHWLNAKNRHLRDRRPLEVLNSGRENSERLVWNAAWEWMKRSPKVDTW